MHYHLFMRSILLLCSAILGFAWSTGHTTSEILYDYSQAGQIPIRSSFPGPLLQSPLPGAHELTLYEKQQYVKEAFLFAWNGYKTFSWGYDENRPVTGEPVDTRQVRLSLVFK